MCHLPLINEELYGQYCYLMFFSQQNSKTNNRKITPKQTSDISIIDDKNWEPRACCFLAVVFYDSIRPPHLICSVCTVHPILGFNPSISHTDCTKTRLRGEIPEVTKDKNQRLQNTIKFGNKLKESCDVSRSTSLPNSQFKNYMFIL